MIFGRMRFSIKLSIFLYFIILQVVAQLNPQPGYFQFPVKPGQPNSLTGNMGELRSNHFHGGIDIRTGWNGIPILAAADGYVSRVQTNPDGYGNMVFVTHPNTGYVTTYAHLDKFYPDLDKAVLEYQYANELNQIDLKFLSNQLKRKKGEAVGISGNTGSSRGPHLHFEIRDTNNNLYNPLHFGFPEIDDKQPPTFERLVVRPIGINSRVKGEFAPAEFKIVKQGKNYVCPDLIPSQGIVGLEIQAKDRISNGSQNAGLSCVEVIKDGQLAFYLNFSIIPFRISNHINAYIDYPTYYKTGSRFQRCYKVDGFELTKYLPANRSGKLAINDTAIHEVTIQISDANGNTADLKIKLKGTLFEQNRLSPYTPNQGKVSFKHHVEENTLVVESRYLQEAWQEAKLYFPNNIVQTLSAAWAKSSSQFFLWDLRKGLPDSININGFSHAFFYRKVLPAKVSQQFSIPSLFTLNIPENALFDTLYLEVDVDDTEKTIRVNQPVIALAAPLQFAIKAESTGAFTPNHGLYLESAAGIYGRHLPGIWYEQVYQFNTKYLGKFKFRKDTIPPTIRPAIVNRLQARFNITDNLSGVRSFRATVNGTWVLMIWDKKQHLIYSRRKDENMTLKGEFVLTVTDYAGNTKEYKKQIL